MEDENANTTNNSSFNFSEVDNITILYLNNPDVVFYSELDSVLKKNLEEKGLNVIRADLSEISFEISSSVMSLYINNEKVKVEGFFSYGYMSQFHHEAYLYILEALEAMKIPCLHCPSVEKILSNKFLQSLEFHKAEIPIPDTYQGYSVNAFKQIANRNFKDSFSIIKKLEEYGGDGVKRCETKELLVGVAAKLLWKNEYSIFQKYIKDSVGKSVRVLCMNNKAVAVAQYVDKSDNYLSNCSYGEFFELRSLMNDPKYSSYVELGERAVKSISDTLLIGGVDILDSEDNGLIVLEVNGFPDLFVICASTKVNLFDIFAETYKDFIIKVRN